MIYVSTSTGLNVILFGDGYARNEIGFPRTFHDISSLRGLEASSLS